MALHPNPLLPLPWHLTPPLPCLCPPPSCPSDEPQATITPEAVEKFGLKFADEDVYELVGVIVG